ncbi:hypothetical protein [Vulcanisaeta distributa]|uniref:hypothetical protein n=1 Tax=Vulcanisaeta distributa TaxID=164451 RepID=UPI0006D17AFC|nr:hypothetical protein [Vulcanisaeta distributa]
MIKLSNYVLYMLVGVVWLILELILTQYTDMALLGIIINMVSMIIISYKPTYSNYIFIINASLLIVMGFLIPSTFLINYTIILIISIVLYLLLVGALEPYSLLLSLLIIYLSYIMERVLVNSPVFNVINPMIKEAGINPGLFTLIFAWYFSLFTISLIIVLLIIFLIKKVLT